MPKILIVAEVKNGEIKKNTLELLSFAKSHGLETDVVLSGSGVTGQADVLAGQGTKWVVVSEMFYGERIQILPFFAWVRWHNTGAAFSFLADAGGWQRWFFVAIGLGFSAYIVRELARLTLAERWMGLVYGLILGGALGNLYGRLVNGYVVDFILVHYQQHIFPAFNVADSALFCGVVFWIALMIRESRNLRTD